MPTEITPDMAGCWFAGSSNRSADELNFAVVHAAFEYGWQPEDRPILREFNAPESTWWEDDRVSEMFSDAATEAEGYLNSIAPHGYVFHFDDGFYMTAVCETEGYEPGHDECPHAESNCPERSNA